MFPSRVHITISVVRELKRDGIRSHNGVCSTFLERCALPENENGDFGM